MYFFPALVAENLKARFVFCHGECIFRMKLHKGFLHFYSSFPQFYHFQCRIDIIYNTLGITSVCISHIQSFLDVPILRERQNISLIVGAQ